MHEGNTIIEAAGTTHEQTAARSRQPEFAEPKQTTIDNRLHRVLRPRRAAASIHAGTLRVERDTDGPGTARTLWPGPLRNAVLLASGGPNPTAVSAQFGESATLTRANLSPRRDKAQDRLPFRGRAGD